MKLSQILISCGDLPAAKIVRISKEGHPLELRLDLLKLKEKDLFALYNKIRTPFIATFRSSLKKDDSKERLGALLQAAECGASFIDLDISDPSPLWKTLKALPDTRLIGSFHNFDTTPPLKTLEVKREKLLEKGCGVVKVACQINSPRDGSVLLEYLHKFPGDIVLGMGDLAKPLRLYAPLYGSLFTYLSPSKKSATAKGQVYYKDALTIYKKLGVLER